MTLIMCRDGEFYSGRRKSEKPARLSWKERIEHRAKEAQRFHLLRKGNLTGKMMQKRSLEISDAVALKSILEANT